MVVVDDDGNLLKYVQAIFCVINKHRQINNI